MDKEGLTMKVIKTYRKGGDSHIDIEQNIPDRRNSNCKGPGVGTCLECSRNTKKACVGGVERTKG